VANIELTQLKGIGPSIVEKLNLIGIFNLRDLCFHLPFGYQDRTKITQIIDLQPGDEKLIKVKILSAQSLYRPRKMMVLKSTDESSNINVRFFYFHPAQTRQLKAGTELLCYGKVSLSRYGLEMIHPEYEVISSDHELKDKKLTPVYRVPKGIGQKKIRSFIHAAISKLDFAEDFLDVEKYDSSLNMKIIDALAIIHNPDAGINIEEMLPGGSHPARVRLLKEEMIAFQAGMAFLKRKQKRHQAFPLSRENEWTAEVQSNFPFELTDAQARVVSEIKEDLSQAVPMMRLVQGDVGSGKTVVGALAAALALDSSFQVAFMAPTTLLAEQHFLSLKSFFNKHAEKVALLTGSTSSSQRKKILQNLKDSKIKLMVGTHALFQKSVEFSNLALIIIDEEHRFGVNQRLALRKKNDSETSAPHQLTLTATPIPRTLSMSVYANMDVSIIDELPPGRKPIQTSCLPLSGKDKLIERISAAIKKGSKVYWICPLIEESENLDLNAVMETYEDLSEHFSKEKVGCLHGKLSANKKQEQIQAFKDSQTSILVSTTVVEVGVDIPDADIMVIENAERFGLAQLHQLRGRIGRGTKESFCILLHKDKIQDISSQRLQVLVDSQDGFKIAEEDLVIRGPGEIMGAQQTGIVPMKYTNLVRDSQYLMETKKVAELICNEEPELANQLIERWISGSIAFADA
jgi:ATP-dependent DNA helicase RecG